MASIAILAATSDRNLALAQRFAGVFEAEGHAVDVIELANMDMPVLPRPIPKSTALLRPWTIFGRALRRPTDGWSAHQNTTVVRPRR